MQLIPTEVYKGLTFIPEIETARKAPAVVCSVASRVVRARQALTKLKNQPEAGKTNYNLKFIEDFMADFISVLPFEADFLSGDITKVDNAIDKYEN